MPYANGRWVYNPYYGNVWTSYDNCGWFTHHYGRWHWDYARGWYWIPSYHWSPAWVSWFWDNDYYGWCPLSWWNRPIVIINNRWDRNYDHHRGIPHHSRSTIVIRKSELSASNMQRVALSKNNLTPTSGKVIPYRGTASGERLSTAKTTVINANGKAVIYKQNSIVSAEKYKISNDTAGGSSSAAVKTAVYKYDKSSDASGKYTPRNSSAKGDDKATATGTSRVYRSKTSDESSASSRVSSSGSSSSGDKLQSKTTARGNSASSSKSSSSAKTSSKTAKKKKDEAAYQALLQSENSAGYKSHAAGSTDNQVAYSAANTDINRFSNRAYESKTSSKARSSGNFTRVISNRFSSARETAQSNSRFPLNGYSSHYEPSSNHAVVQGGSYYQNYSTASPKSNSYNSNSLSRTYSTAVRSSSTVRSNTSSRASYSAPTISSGRSVAVVSRPSSSTTAIAKKKKN
jgi:hypothetical protein